jgi:hypothetical protein
MFLQNVLAWQHGDVVDAEIQPTPTLTIYTVSDHLFLFFIFSDKLHI